MVKCPVCGNVVRSGDRFCGDCGVEAPQPELIGPPDREARNVSLSERDPDTREEVKATAAAGADDRTRSPIGVEIDANRVYHSGKNGVLTLRLAAVAALHSVSLEVSCECVGQTLRSKPEKNWAAGEKRTVLIQWVPGRAGEALVNLDVAVEDASGLPTAYSGVTSLIVLDPADRGTQTSFQVDIHDIDKFMGNDLSSLVNASSPGRGQLDPEALRKHYRSGEPLWMAVDLFREHDLTALLRSRARRVVDFGGSAAPRAVSAKMTGADGLEVRVFSSPELRFGRRQQTNDVVLRFLPNTAETEQQSLAISRDHFTLSVSGGGLVLRNAGSSTTTVAAKPVGGLSETRLTDTWTMTVGLLGLELAGQVLRLPAPGLSDPTHAALVAHDPARASGTRPPGHDVSAVRISRVNNAPRLRYCWLLTIAMVGRDPHSGVVIDDPTVDERHARLRYWMGRYYLEDAGSVEGTWIDGQRLQEGEIAALGVSNTIRFGACTLEWVLCE